MSILTSRARDHQFDSNGTVRAGGGHRGVTEIVRSLESTPALVKQMVVYSTERSLSLVSRGPFSCSGRSAT